MNTLYRSTSGLIGALALAGIAFAQVPSTNDVSDGHSNTGMGTAALGGPAGSNGGYQNTASGFGALYSNMTGSGNTASGFEAMYSNTTGGNNIASGYQALYSNTTGSNNTASGFDALLSNTTGNQNTASGYDALYSNTTGYDNTAAGYGALYSNTTGYSNTASGYFALNLNTTGFDNTAAGLQALLSNTSGYDNTASGYQALLFNTTGSWNTASGSYALRSNTTGNNNTASGVDALASNTTGDYNTASGYGALYSTTGNSNTASGYEALYGNTSGIQNTASGVHALAANTTGSNNIAEGYHAGYNLTTGSNNIDIGSPGVAAESGVIRIGTITGTTSTQSAAYIAGIYGVKTATAGTAVFIDSEGQLGTVSSSIRYKEDVQLMADASERLLKLRPVKFRYKKADASGEKPIQYGLIAEEVAEVYPELVVRDATTGRIDGVRYDELAPMLVNEMQQEHQKNAAQEAEIHDLKQQMAAMHAALLKVQGKDESVAQR
jgi:hypothetical protein